MRRIAVMLEGRYRPPGRFTHWEPKMIELIVKRTLYKGEFIAHRSMEVKVPVTSGPVSLTESVGKTVSRKIQRSPEEWIVVRVPAIIAAEDWELANRIVADNRNKGRREASSPFLLTGLITCATCGYRYIGRLHKEWRGPCKKEVVSTSYRCSSRANRVPTVIEEIGCNQKQISMRILDHAVWSVIYEVLLNPEIMIGALEREFHGEQNEQIRSQIEFLESQIRELKIEDERLYSAYLAGAFDENEYAEHRTLVKSQQQRHQADINRLMENVMSSEQFEERKQEIIAICQNAARSGLVFDAPFDVQQRIIKTIIDKITLNANEGWFEIEGVVSGKYLFDGVEPNPETSNFGGTNGGGENMPIVYPPARAAITATRSSPVRAPQPW